MTETPGPGRPEFRYDEVPYESHAYSASHPSHLAMLGRLFGIPTPALETARILEIGCSSGGNIVPVAAQWPDSQCVGFDLSKVEIDEGLRRVAPLGLKNLELRHANVMDVDASWGQFDYIICHGVWSWVPKFVQERIFEICRDRMSPNGVAYISYNVYPGWRLRQMIRDMMMYHVHAFETPKEKTQQARALLDFLVNVHGANATHPYVVWMRQEADLLRKQADSYLYHDHLSDTNEPVYFHDFAEQAREKGLIYLSDAQFSTMMTMHMPGGARSFLDGIGDLVKVEQYMDFVRNRAFRSSLLVHAAAPVRRNLDWNDMVGFHYGCRGTFVTDGPLGDRTVEGKITLLNETSMTTKEPIMKAALTLLIAAWPDTIQFEDLVLRAREAYGATVDVEADRQELGGLMLSCLANDLIEVRSTAVRVARVSERPEVHPWARVQIGYGARYATNLRHEGVGLDPMVRQVVMLLDGQHTREDVLTLLINHAKGGGVQVTLPDGRPADNDNDFRLAFEEAYDHALARAEELSLLVR